MKDRVNYIVDSFTDYKGLEHKFVVAAVASVLDEAVFVEDRFNDDFMGLATKVVRLGISICNPVDTFNEKVGILKASARAEQNDPSIYFDGNYFGKEAVVKALMEELAHEIKKNPGDFIEGYDESKRKYFLRLEMEKIASELTDFDKEIMAKLNKDKTCLDKVLNYWLWAKKHGVSQQ